MADKVAEKKRLKKADKVLLCAFQSWEETCCHCCYKISKGRKNSMMMVMIASVNTSTVFAISLSLSLYCRGFHLYQKGQEE